MDVGKTGQMIAGLRKDKNMTQQDLADILGVTNKTVSKWENGKGMPDISVMPLLSDALGVSIDELVRGRRYEGRDMAPEFAVPIRRMANKFSSYIKEADMKKKAGWVVLFFFLIFVAAQAFYLLLHIRYRMEYLYDWLFVLVNQLIIMFMILGIFLTLRAAKRRWFILTAIFLVLTLGNISCLVSGRADMSKTIASRSGSGNLFVLKRDYNNGQAAVYRSELGVFVQQKDTLPYTVSDGGIKLQWLNSDNCAVTYESPDDGNVHQYVATFGDRGSGSGFYQVISALATKTWSARDVGGTWEFCETGSGFAVRHGKAVDEFGYSDCVQFGTTTIVLCRSGLPKWTVSLNEDCEVEGGVMVSDGSITVCQVSLDKTAPVVFYAIANGE